MLVTNEQMGTVFVHTNGRVATLELNRPDMLNALNREMLRQMAWKLKEITQMDEIDIVVVKGNGRAFCAGGDIKEMLTSMNENEFYQTMDYINELIVTLYSMPKVTICAVKGAAAGLGFSLALATDYIIAEADSKFAMNFINIGLIPDGGAHFFLEKRLGEMKAMEVIWEGKTLSASETKELGLIQSVCEKDLDLVLENKVDEWLKKPIEAMIKTKKILAENSRPQLLKILELEKQGQFKMMQTKDHQEGIRAFLEKRTPHFIGK